MFVLTDGYRVFTFFSPTLPRKLRGGSGEKKKTQSIKGKIKKIQPMKKKDRKKEKNKDIRQQS